MKKQYIFSKEEYNDIICTLKTIKENLSPADINKPFPVYMVTSCRQRLEEVLDILTDEEE